MRIGFYFENSNNLNAIPVPTSKNFIDPRQWHADNRDYANKIGFNGGCNLHIWLKYFHPESVITKLIGDDTTDCDVNVFIITLSGNASKYIYQNIFGFIKKETLEFLHKHNITIIIDYASERPHMWHAPKFSSNMEWCYVIPTIIYNAMALKVSVPIKFLLGLSADGLNRLRENYPIYKTNNTSVNISFDSYQNFWLYYRYNVERNIEYQYKFNVNGNVSDSKFFVCLMGVAKKHRLAVMSKLIEYKLFPYKGYSSLFFDGYTQPNIELMKEPISKYRNTKSKYNFNLNLIDFNKNYTVDKFLTFNELEKGDLIPPVDILNDIYLNIVLESWSGKVGAIPTEKSFKPFYWKKLPLIYGTVRLVNQLKELGFEFLDIFNYTYDDINIIIDEDQTVNFCKNLEILQNFTKSDIKNIYEENINLIEHNYNLFMNKKMFNLVEHLFV